MSVCFSVTGILKCKKDKAYEGGQLCATCFSPKKLHKQELQKLRDMACVKPSIESPLRHNASSSSSGSSEDEQEQDTEDDSQLSPESLHFPPWNISLNMTDEHGNTVSLACDIRKPTDAYKLQLNQTDSQEIDINATVALDFECPMTRDKYEKLWKLIAYYSEVPVTLHQEVTVTEGPGDTVHYRQDANEDALYYTGVRAHILAEPEWVTQPSIQLQLNRRQSTAKKVLLSYYAHFSLTLSGKDAGQARARSWVMIEPAAAGQGAQTVLEGTSCQLSCNVKASESPSIFWVLPDGSVLKGPMEDPDGKFSILTSGWLRIKSTERSDSGLYQCIAQVRDEMDRIVYRLLVEPPAAQPSGGPTVTIEKNPGESLLLPCNTQAVPEAQVSWILPNKRMVHHLANTSQVYLLPNGTLSIPKVQVSDGGLYRCVAVNRQGADRFTVGVTVAKKGSGKSSKRGRRPGGKTLPRLRGDVVEDEGGSGAGDDNESPPRRLLHPKDQETFLKTKEDAGKSKKGRRKPKPWKNSEKEPESNIAEGRRVFESRRRINMAGKQINPEHWADILARVRGKNLPKGTAGPEAVKSATPPSLLLEVTAAVPVASPPSIAPGQTAASAEESSADASLFGEEEQVSGTVSSSSSSLERGQMGVSLADAKATSPDLEEFTVEAFSEKPGGLILSEVASTWASATTLVSSVPSKPSPVPQTWDATSEEPAAENTPAEDRSAGGIAPMPAPPSHEDQSSLDATSLAESELETSVAESELETSVSPALEINSQPDADKVDMQDSRYFTPTSTSPLAESRTPEPAGDFISGEPDVPARGHRQEEMDSPLLAKAGVSTQGKPLRKKGAAKNSLMLQEGDMVERHPPRSRGPDGRSQRKQSSSLLDSTPGGKHGVAAFEGPREATLGSLFDKDTTTVATTMSTQKATMPPAPTTHSPRKRPNGRRRLRPHKLRHRHKQTPPTTSAATETFSTPPTQAPDVKTPKQVDALLVPTSWVQTTVGTPKHVEVGTRAEQVTKGSPRRKHGKRPNKHRYSTSTVSSTVFASKPSPSSENERASVTTPGAETSPVSATVSLRAGGPRETTRVADYGKTTLKTPAPRHAFQDTVPATRQPASDDKEKENYSVTNVDDGKRDGLVPAESGMNVVSPSGSEVFATGALKEEPGLSGFAGPGGWDPPSPAQPGTPHTDTPATTCSENLMDSSPFLEESEGTELPSAVSPSEAVSTVFQQEEAVPSTSLASTEADSSSHQAQATLSGQEFYETTAALPRPGTGPENPLRPPAPVEEPASPPPPTTLASVVQTTTEPAPLTPTASPMSTDSKENVSFNYVGIPQSKAPPGKTEGTEPTWTTNELPTPTPREEGVKLTPKQGLGKGASDERSKNILPRGPDPHHQDGRAHVFRQPTPVPPRETMRPPHMTTQSPFRHVVTLQPPRYLTNKPGITAYPLRVLPANKHSTPPKLSSPATPGGPWHSSKPHNLPDRGAERLSGNSRVFGSNKLPDLRDPVGKLPNARVPHYPGGRFPFFFNRTFSFPQLGVTVRPPTATSPPTGMAERKVNPSPSNGVLSHSVSHMDLGPPAPPLFPRPRTVSPPSTNMQNLPVVHPTRSSMPFVTSAGPPSRSFHQSSSKFFSAAGPPASKFWTLGEKPQIVTKAPETVSVMAETDVVLPCEATGKPKPFVTWTKVSTGRMFKRLHVNWDLLSDGVLLSVASGTSRGSGGWGGRLADRERGGITDPSFKHVALWRQEVRN